MLLAVYISAFPSLTLPAKRKKCNLITGVTCAKQMTVSNTVNNALY